MKWVDAVLGRSKQVRPDLDSLFAVPDAAVTLEVALGLRPTGAGSVCFRAAEGAAFATVQGDLQTLLDADGGPQVEASTDAHGYTWLVARHDPSELPALVTDLHAINSTLQDNGFAPSLLCSLVGFAAPDGRRLGLVYLYKRGTFYPFAPTGDGEQRDNALELQVRSALASDLRIEPDLSRWFPVWDAPGL
ncbi:MAG TPA: hypothetical protein VF423_06990 [Actinomycetes bacterium]